MRGLTITKNILRDQSSSLDSYLREIWKTDLLLEQEEVLLAQKIKQWDEIALEKLVKANLRFVVSVAKQYQNQHLPLPDLINEWNLWLIKAAKRFDEKRGFKFISYAVRWIRQAILLALSDQTRNIRLPGNIIWDTRKINRATSLLEQQLEREPTDEEIAAELDISLSRVSIAIEAKQLIISLDKPIDIWDGNTGSLLDILSEEEETEIPDALNISDLKKDLAYHLTVLDSTEKLIISLAFWIDMAENLSDQEIATILNMFKRDVKKIKTKALRRLKNNYQRQSKNTYEDISADDLEEEKTSQINDNITIYEWDDKLRGELDFFMPDLTLENTIVRENNTPPQKEINICFRMIHDLYNNIKSPDIAQANRFVTTILHPQIRKDSRIQYTLYDKNDDQTMMVWNPFITYGEYENYWPDLIDDIIFEHHIPFADIISVLRKKTPGFLDICDSKEKICVINHLCTKDPLSSELSQKIKEHVYTTLASIPKKSLSL